MFEAFAQVGAGGLFADGVQFLLAQNGFECGNFGRIGRLGAYPGRHFQAFLWNDFDRDTGGFGFAFMKFDIGHDVLTILCERDLLN